MTKLAVRIMAVRSRKPIVDRLLAQLGMDESIVFYDDAGIGCIRNSARCWAQPATAGETHIMVLQDDIEVVNGFLNYAEQMVTAFPRAIFTLHYKKIRYEDQKTRSPYLLLKNKNVSGEGIIMPKEIAERYIEFFKANVEHSSYPHDDGAIRTFALLNDIPVFTTVPALINNLCPTDSVIDKSHNDKNAKTHVWRGRDASTVDFGNKAYSICYYPTFLQMPEFNEAIKEGKKRRYV